MKLLPSPSISSSSSSRSSFPFDPTFCASKSTTAGCIAGIFRRILRSRSIPTHPSDNISSSSIEIHQIEETKVVPGIVARLMGLDSTVPEISLLDDQVKSNSMSRSRSMNSVDCSGKECDRVEGKHRRVKSSISLMEIPIFLEQEDDEFLVLSFEKEGEGRKKSKQRKGKKNKASKKTLSVLIEEEISQRIASKCENFEGSNSDLVINEVPDEAKSRKKKKKKRANCGAEENLEQECSSKESSPVSVLEFDQFIINQECDQDEDIKLDSRRKLSTELENCESTPCPREDDDLKKSDGGIKGKNCFHFQDTICSLTDTELCNSTWFISKVLNYGEVEDIVADFESSILDHMLDELLVHLSDFC